MTLAEIYRVDDVMNTDRLKIHGSDVTTEACAWIAQLETGDLTPADVSAFQEWMQRSPRHAAEIRRLAVLSGELNILAELEPSLREAAKAYRPVLRDPPVHPIKRWLKANSALRSLAAVGFVVLLTLAVVLQGSFNPGFPTNLETPVGGYLERTLSDGSIIKLNTDSRVNIAYNEKQRHVFLVRGEGFFEVAHDSARPFIVHAQGKTIRAVGTAFAVRLGPDDLQLTVTEGVVALRKTLDMDRESNVAESGYGSEHGQPLQGNDAKEMSIAEVKVRAGERLITTLKKPKPSISSITVDEVRRSLSWRDGLFDFSEAMLADVIKEFERHTKLKIEIVDAGLKSKKFSGIFPTGNIEPLLEALEKAYGIDVIYVDSNTVHLAQKSPIELESR